MIYNVSKEINTLLRAPLCFGVALVGALVRT
jgi:hypothetical protein